MLPEQSAVMEAIAAWLREKKAIRAETEIESHGTVYSDLSIPAARPQARVLRARRAVPSHAFNSSDLVWRLPINQAE